MDARLGAQVWIEPDDDPERIDLLVGRAAAVGLGRLRVFLMWPWIQPEPDVWNFALFDAVFDAAARHGVGIKATLTATSAPYHVGTPSVLHTNTATLEAGQRPAMRRYLEACVGRYTEPRTTPTGRCPTAHHCRAQPTPNCGASASPASATGHRRRTAGDAAWNPSPDCS